MSVGIARVCPRVSVTLSYPPCGRCRSLSLKKDTVGPLSAPLLPYYIDESLGSVLCGGKPQRKDRTSSDGRRDRHTSPVRFDDSLHEAESEA